MESKYDHKKYERGIYDEWEKKGAFSPPSGEEAKKQGKKPFCVIMPPPNANDPLHVGHAMFVTVEDVLIRYHRMRGEASLWLPGTDHAGIETQYVFEKKLAKEGKSRFDFGPEKLYQMIEEYVKENSGVAVKQMRQLGASADWNRFKFTLDKEVVSFVLDTFIKLHQDGLVYRGKRLVNYCVKCGTSYSELEVEHEERNDPLYYIKYGPLVLATVRPETKFGDTAVAVHPKDKRYQDWIGKEIEVEGLTGKFKLKVIADKGVDPEFGTGVVKVTPAHDPNDFEIGKGHGLEMKQVIGFDGKLTELAGKYAGLSVREAREKTVKDLEKKGLLEKIDESYRHRVGVCYRCHRVIEPLPKVQFFIKTKPLAAKVIEALDKGRVKIYGKGREAILRHWLNNIQDWNISRQIVWGIRMPVWYKKGEKEEDYVVSKKCPGEGYVQEEDTFDTWFSSGQWPVVTLKTNKEGDFEYYYPTKVMETAYDILPFWVMRMLMLGIYLTGEVPFEDVYLHGLIRDEKGQKMSKSLGNVIDPLNLVEKYGADALRMALVMSTTAGSDSSVGEEKIRGMRNLSNKIWNAGRFIKMSLEETKVDDLNKRTSWSEEDKKFIKRQDGIVKQVTEQLEKYQFGLATEKLYGEFWHWFCDKGIEEAKKGKISYQALFHGLVVFLKLLHPFMPFVTETVWGEIKTLRKQPEQMLIEAEWPG